MSSSSGSTPGRRAARNLVGQAGLPDEDLDRIARPDATESSLCPRGRGRGGQLWRAGAGADQDQNGEERRRAQMALAFMRKRPCWALDITHVACGENRRSLEKRGRLRACRQGSLQADPRHRNSGPPARPGAPSLVERALKGKRILWLDDLVASDRLEREMLAAFGLKIEQVQSNGPRWPGWEPVRVICFQGLVACTLGELPPNADRTSRFSPLREKGPRPHGSSHDLIIPDIARDDPTEPDGLAFVLSARAAASCR